jgi:hypothetical protein
LNARPENSDSPPRLSIPSEAKKGQPKVMVARDGKSLGEYPMPQLPVRLAAGHLMPDDFCLDPETNRWIPVSDMVAKIPSYAKHARAAADPEAGYDINQPPKDLRIPAILLILLLLTAAFFSGIAAWRFQQDAQGLAERLAKAEAETAEWKEKFQKVLFAAREVADTGTVRGRVILRDATGRRTALPGVKLRIYPRDQIESHLNSRRETAGQAAGSDPTRLATHYLKELPAPLDVTSSDSDGRFELKVPSPGEYVIQTAIRSAKTGELRMWFVRFDSSDPLNTPVDITESNGVQQFNPLLMIVDGR